ncbi:MAG: ABC transporter permease [Armatimonadetes bacterium]|nr:ABC transporter permease [Armatimonadota bacterium]MDE2207915.1 ABC transporter permease [Armatimonadota bacterium]
MPTNSSRMAVWGLPFLAIRSLRQLGMEPSLRNIVIITRLTVRETMRNRLYLISVVIAFFFFLISLMPLFFGKHDVPIPTTGRWQSVAVLMVVFMGVPMLKFFSAIEVIGLSCGAVSSEIERGILVCILAKPMPRWHVLAGKWLGINCVMALNLLFWTTLLWVSLLVQTHQSFPTLFLAGAVSMLYPVMFSTLTLMFSTFCTTALAASFALVCGAAAWPHLLIRIMGMQFHVRALVLAGTILRYLTPLNHVEVMVERSLGTLSPRAVDPNFFNPPVKIGPPAGGIWYVAAWTIAAAIVALIVFQHRDIHA